MDGITIATASQWQRHRYSRNKGKQPSLRTPCSGFATKIRASPFFDLTQRHSFSTTHDTVMKEVELRPVMYGFHPGNASLLLRNRPVGWQLTNVPPSWQTLLLWWCIGQDNFTLWLRKCITACIFRRKSVFDISKLIRSLIWRNKNACHFSLIG